MRAALCGSNFLAVSTADTGFSISTKGVSRAGGYARAAGRMRPVLRVLLPALPRALRCHVRALVCVHVYARAGVRLL